MRPIDADALFEPNESTDKVFIWTGRTGGKTLAIAERLMRERVKMAPTLTLADLRPKGHWNVVEFDEVSRRITIECSECGTVEEMTVMAYGFGHNFCHICGADMRGGGEDARQLPMDPGYADSGHKGPGEIYGESGFLCAQAWETRSAPADMLGLRTNSGKHLSSER